MKNAKSKVKFMCLCLILTLFLSGCQIGGREVKFTFGLGNQDVFKIGNRTISVTQAKVYLSNYQNIYGNAYGLNLWKNKDTKATLEDYVKNITLSQLAQVVCMDQLAEKENITLTKEEKDNVKKASKVYYKSLSKEEKDYMGADEATIEGMYEDYALAQKLYASLTGGVNEEVSDDEARIMHLMQIYVTDKNTADQITQSLNTGGDFDSLATQFNQAADIEITVGRGTLPKEVEDVAFSMENDQVSSCITTSNGYYFIKCVNKYDKELTQKNKVTIAQEREKKAFNDTYAAFAKKIDKEKNDSLWEDMKLNINKNIKTNSFFHVYDEYCTPTVS